MNRKICDADPWPAALRFGNATSDQAIGLGADGNGSRGSAALDRSPGEILRKLAMPFAGLGGNRALGGRPLFCSTSQIETLVRHHSSHSPNHPSAHSNLRAKSESMVNIHRGLPVPIRDNSVTR